MERRGGRCRVVDGGGVPEVEHGGGERAQSGGESDADVGEGVHETHAEAHARDA